MLAMRLVGLADGTESPVDGRFLVEYDPCRDGVAPDGSMMPCHLVATDDIALAMKFADLDEFRKVWTLVDKRNPIRPDGRPNRPLTAFSVCTEIVGSDE